MKQPAFFIDASACTGCKTCMAACRDGHAMHAGGFFRRVAEYAGGQWARGENGTAVRLKDVFAYYVSVSCCHCTDPICVRNCPTTAMHKDEQGIVWVDHRKCVGCRYCEWCCPFSAPQFDPARGMMDKCDCCRDRLAEGKKPLCAEACPMRAIEFGEYEDLLAEHGGECRFIAPLPDPSLTGPCLLVRPPRDGLPAGSPLGRIANTEEM